MVPNGILGGVLGNLGDLRASFRAVWEDFGGLRAAFGATWGAKGAKRSQLRLKLGPSWGQRDPQRGPRGVDLEPQGPSGSIFGQVGRKTVIYCKPTFSFGKTTNSEGPGKVRGSSGRHF